MAFFLSTLGILASAALAAIAFYVRMCQPAPDQTLSWLIGFVAVVVIGIVAQVCALLVSRLDQGRFKAQAADALTQLHEQTTKTDAIEKLFTEHLVGVPSRARDEAPRSGLRATPTLVGQGTFEERCQSLAREIATFAQTKAHEAPEVALEDGLFATAKTHLEYAAAVRAGWSSYFAPLVRGILSALTARGGSDPVVATLYEHPKTLRDMATIAEHLLALCPPPAS